VIDAEELSISKHGGIPLSNEVKELPECNSDTKQKIKKAAGEKTHQPLDTTGTAVPAFPTH